MWAAALSGDGFNPVSQIAHPRLFASRTGQLPGKHQRWRSMFVDEIEHPALTDDRWETADNSHSPHSNCIDHLAAHIPPK
ncbi:MAG: hypothetical protein ACRDZY_06660 [Acidimicrobiales bacterium]